MKGGKKLSKISRNEHKNTIEEIGTTIGFIKNPRNETLPHETATRRVKKNWERTIPRKTPPFLVLRKHKIIKKLAQLRKEEFPRKAIGKKRNCNDKSQRRNSAFFKGRPNKEVTAKSK